MKYLENFWKKIRRPMPMTGHPVPDETVLFIISIIIITC